MLKVHILDRCPYCDGWASLLTAYLPAGEATNRMGETYTRYAPCQMCEEIGVRGKWVSLPDFLDNVKGKPQGLPYFWRPRGDSNA